MAGCLDGVSVRRHLLRKSVLAAALILIEIGLNVPTAYAQPGFISIDCGSAQASYKDSNNLEWVADNGTYMSLGNTIEQPSAGETQALQSLRYFPEGRSKYCYELSISNTSDAYLVRVSFYMNGTVLNKTRPFQFILSVDANNWFTLTSGDDSQSELLIVQEGIFYPPNPIMNICLQPVVGEPFISSLELRQLDNSMYSYEGGSSQYLSLSYRLNAGALSQTRDVRYPDDPYDRIWTTPADWANVFPSISNSLPPDNMVRAGAYYVPPKVMQDAWVFTNLDYGVFFQVYVDGPQLYLTPGDYVFVVVYAENLNSSVSGPYTASVGLDFIPTGKDLTISSQATSFVQPYYILGQNTLIFSMGSSDSNYSPVMNALEFYGQYRYNDSMTNSDDVQVITALKTGFSLTDWKGDPCTPVPHDWLSCNLTKPTLGALKQPCGRNGTSLKNCDAPQVDLHSKYYVTSVNLSDRSTSGFSGTLGGLPQKTLAGLNKMSITKSGVDSPTFQSLLNFTSQALSLLDFSHNNLTGVVSSFEGVPFFETLQYLNLSYNAMTSFPATRENASIQSLVILDLSHNQFQGDISSLDLWVEINNSSLQELYISNNGISGIFSSDLYFSGLPKLTIANFNQNSIQGLLNLSKWYIALQEADKNLSSSAVTLQLFSFVNNNISNIIPSAEDFDPTIKNLVKNTNGSFTNKGILLGGNPYCKSPNSYMHQYLCRSSINDIIENKKGNDKKTILIISICSGIVGLLLLCVLFITLWKLWKQVYALREIQQALVDRKVQPPFYHYSDLKLATRDFHKDNKLGHGGFGIVYKGLLVDETLAVKKLFNSHRLQVLDEFLNEVVLITGIKHRNLVQLKGCCIKDKQRILVYECVEKGNLAEALWGSKAYGGLNWEQRFKICVGIARGLSYLHEELQPSIIHRDIKPENILLDNNFSPKIADFGLARHVSSDASLAHSTKIAGTLGYFAPEYVMQGQLSDKIDVYSYGIVILEVVSGRKCIDPSRPLEEKFLKDWVVSMRKKNLLFDVLQTELRENCAMAEVIRAIQIGLLCTQHYPERRPTMSQVVTMFLGNMDIRVFPDEATTNTMFDKMLATINHDTGYPTLEIIEEDSSVFPLLDLESQSSLNTTSRGSSSRPLIELGTFHGR